MADLESGWNQVHTFHAIHKGLGRFSRKADSSRAFLSDHRLNLTKSCTLKPVNHTADEMRFPLVLHHHLSAHILAAGSLVAVWCMGAAGMLCCFCRGSFDQSEHATRWATSICVINIMCVFIYTYIHIHIYILDSTAYTCVPIIDPNLDICRLYCRLFILKFHMTVTYYKFKIWSVIELSGRSILQFLVRNLSCCHKTITVHFLWVPALCQAYYISRGGLDTEWKPMVFGIEAPLRKKRFGGSKLDARYCNGQGLMKALWLLKS